MLVQGVPLTVFTCWLKASYWVSLRVGSRRPIECLYMLSQGVLLSGFTCWLKASYWVALHVGSGRPIEWLYMLAQGVLLSVFICWLKASYWVSLHVDSRRPIECLYMLTQGVLLTVFCFLSHVVPLYSDPRLNFDPVRPFGSPWKQTYVVLKLVCRIVRLSTHPCIFRYDEERFSLA